METEPEVRARIAELEEEERDLRETAEGDGEGLDPSGRARLAELEVELDRRWDQIRRFRAGTPDAGELRSTREVEGYLQ